MYPGLGTVPVKRHQGELPVLNQAEPYMYASLSGTEESHEF